MKMKLFGLTQTKLFHFINVKTGAGREGSSKPSEPPLDPPLTEEQLNATNEVHTSDPLNSTFPP